MRNDSEDGFSLIEVLVAIALFSVVSIGFYSVMLSTVRGSDTTESVVRISEEARAGFNRMIRDTREAEVLTYSEPNRFGIRTDFNNDGLIQSPNTSGDYENLIYERVGNRIVVKTAEDGPESTLIEGVQPLPGRSGVFTYTSNLLEYDWNGDGVTTCGELNEASGTHSVLGVGDNDPNGRCDDGEHQFLANVDFAFQVVESNQRSSFFAQAQLRNNR